MDILDLVSGDAPVGLIGCRATRDPMECCEFDLAVFDGGGGSVTTALGGVPVRISRVSFDALSKVWYHPMSILRDPSWDLRPRYAEMAKRRRHIFQDHAKDCVFNALFCCTRAEMNADLAACWSKSALVHLAYRAVALAGKTPRAAHCMADLRKHDDSSISWLYERLGLDRASPSLLRRMCDATVGFSDLVGNGDSIIIRAKHDYFAKHSMVADCYMYLLCVNRANMHAVRDSLHRNPEYVRILGTAFDASRDTAAMQDDLNAIRSMCFGHLRAKDHIRPEG